MIIQSSQHLDVFANKKPLSILDPQNAVQIENDSSSKNYTSLYPGIIFFFTIFTLVFLLALSTTVIAIFLFRKIESIVNKLLYVKIEMYFENDEIDFNALIRKFQISQNFAFGRQKYQKYIQIELINACSKKYVSLLENYNLEGCFQTQKSKRIQIVTSIQIGQNLLVNSDFSQPDITSFNSIYINFPNSIPGWNCTNICELNNCQYSNRVSIRDNLYHGYFGDCDRQVIDLSPDAIEAISQIFTTEQGEHQFHISYLLPSFSANRKTLEIYLNGLQIYCFRPIYETDFSRYSENFSIYPKNGHNNITLTMSGLSDPFGYRIVNIQIRRYKDLQLNKTLAIFLKNQLLVNIVSIPSSRVILGQLIDFLSSLDRLQLYAYHNRNYSSFYEVLISGVYDILSSKGQVSQQLAQRTFPSLIDHESSILSAFDFKCPSNINDQNACLGFISNNHNFFIYSLPLVFMEFFILHSIFKILFKKKISKIIRIFSFYGTILLMITEGNIQQFAFQLTDELINLISFSPQQKIINLFAICFFFLIFFCSTGIYFCFWFIYKKQVNYFTDGININPSGIITFSLDKGLFCLLLGITHRLMISKPSQQLFVLAGIEITWISAQIYGLQKELYKHKLLVGLNIVEGFIRVIFQGTLYAYDNVIKDMLLRADIDRLVHLKVVYCFVLIWVINIIVSLIAVSNELIQILQKKQRAIKAPKLYVKSNINNIFKGSKRSPLAKVHQKVLSQKRKTMKIKIMGKLMKLVILKQ